MTTQEAAERLQTNVRVVQRWIKDGRLPARKHGRDWDITEEAVAAFRKLPVGRPPKAGPPSSAA